MSGVTGCRSPGPHSSLCRLCALTHLLPPALSIAAVPCTQRLVAMKSECLHKDEMLRLLTAEVK